MLSYPGLTRRYAAGHRGSDDFEFDTNVYCLCSVHYLIAYLIHPFIPIRRSTESINNFLTKSTRRIYNPALSYDQSMQLSRWSLFVSDGINSFA